MQDLVPIAGQSPLVSWGITEPEKYKIPYKLEFIMQFGGNPMMAIADPKAFEKAFKEDIFTVNFNIYLDESAEFADIVLPDACYLERLDLKADRESCISLCVVLFRSAHTTKGTKR